MFYQECIAFKINNNNYYYFIIVVVVGIVIIIVAVFKCSTEIIQYSNGFLLHPFCC